MLSIYTWASSLHLSVSFLSCNSGNNWSSTYSEKLCKVLAHPLPLFQLIISYFSQWIHGYQLSIMSSTQINSPEKNIALQLIPHLRAALFSALCVCCIYFEKQQLTLMCVFLSKVNILSSTLCISEPLFLCIISHCSQSFVCGNEPFCFPRFCPLHHIHQPCCLPNNSSVGFVFHQKQTAVPTDL